MSDGEKTEQPTPKRRLDARRKGEIPQSRDLNNALVLLFVCILLSGIGSYIYFRIKHMMGFFIHFSFGMSLGIMDLRSIRTYCFQFVFSIIAPLLCGTFFITILIQGMQTNFSVFEDRIGFKPDKLDPIKNLQNLFSLKQMVLPFLIIAKVIAIITVGYLTISPVMSGYIHHLGLSNEEFLGKVWMTSMNLMFRTSILMIGIGGIDYAVQWRSMEKKLMMTKQEVKEEFKREEVSPEIKQQIRMRFQKLAQARMMKKVPESTVVITNPTTLAIAIKYNREEMDTPQILAKGRGLIAERIRDIAKENKIPVVENKPLTRAMYPLVEMNDLVPPEFFQAVALVLAYVYQNTKPHKRKKLKF